VSSWDKPKILHTFSFEVGRLGCPWVLTLTTIPRDFEAEVIFRLDAVLLPVTNTDRALKAKLCISVQQQMTNGLVV